MRLPHATATCAAALMLAVVSALSGITSARAADLHGDDEADRYVGTGGLVLPGSIGVHIRTEVAECLGCQWRLTSPCQQSDAGNPFSGTPVCLSVVRGCPGMAELLRSWFRPADGPWREVGLVCIGAEGPITVVALAEQVRDRVVRAVPAQGVRWQPAIGVVTQIPLVFDSGQNARPLRDTLALAGQSVTFEATPRWRWEYGDGAVLATVNPGGAYPDRSVAHAYRKSSVYRIRLATTWSAVFTIDGMGPFSVAEPVVQTTAVSVSVGEGRAVLAAR